MALDHEEQEQLAALKGWWQEHGNLIVTAVVAVALAAAGWRGWNWYQSKQALEASTLYQMLTRAVQAGDAKTMASRYSGFGRQQRRKTPLPSTISG